MEIPAWAWTRLKPTALSKTPDPSPPSKRQPDHLTVVVFIRSPMGVFGESAAALKE